jgi:transposase-like protein
VWRGSLGLPILKPSEASFCSSRRRLRWGDGEILGRIERRRKWSDAEKAALLAEVDAAGGKVVLIARRHRLSESLL